MTEPWFIRAKQRPGMRRAGVYFPHEGISVNPADFDAAQLALLETEAGLLIADHAPALSQDEPPEDWLEEVVEVLGMIGGDKKPNVKAVESVLGHDITAAERDRAWEVYQQRLEGV